MIEVLASGPLVTSRTAAARATRRWACPGPEHSTAPHGGPANRLVGNPHWRRRARGDAGRPVHPGGRGLHSGAHRRTLPRRGVGHCRSASGRASGCSWARRPLECAATLRCAVGSTCRRSSARGAPTHSAASARHRCGRAIASRSAGSPPTRSRVSTQYLRTVRLRCGCSPARGSTGSSPTPWHCSPRSNGASAPIPTASGSDWTGRRCAGDATTSCPANRRCPAPSRYRPTGGRSSSGRTRRSPAATRWWRSWPTPTSTPWHRCALGTPSGSGQHRVQHQPHQRGHRGGGRDREYPGEHDVAGDAPAHCGEAAESRRRP